MGRDLAIRIFNQFPGQWQVRQIAGADRAYSFWLKVIAEFTKGSFANEHVFDPEWGMVWRQRFKVSDENLKEN